MFTVLKNFGSKQKVLVIPPDYTRLPSHSGEFREDKQIDQQIRKYRYFGIPHTLKWIKENDDLCNNLAAAAHLIHGSFEHRFELLEDGRAKKLS